MRIVAIRTLHEAFVDAVLAGHFELRADAGVASVTQLGPLLGEQKLECWRMMNGMAGSAGDTGQRVLRAAYVGLLKIARVASETGFERFGLRHQGERIRNGGLAAVCGHVRFARPVAAFTASAAGRQIARRYAFEMRVLIEVQPDVGMAGLAGAAAHVSGCARCAGALRSPAGGYNCQ